jgi:hypothetical protein
MTVEAAVAIVEGYSDRAKKRFVRLTRRFGGVMSTVSPNRLSRPARRHYLRPRTTVLRLQRGTIPAATSRVS